jgi:peptide/nickel transport system ATP-binding protein/oligopeptide transport system ATP-binding protein
MPNTSQPTPQLPLLRIEGLTCHYVTQRSLLGKPTTVVQALRGVSLQVEAGQVLGIVGESGCGKSTLGRCILRLDEPTAGKVWLDGVELTALSAKAMRAQRKHVQMIFQNPYASLNPRMRLGDCLAEPMEIHKLGTAKQRKMQVAQLLGQVGLSADMASRWPHELSGGQRQRVGIARALASQPKLILADEPVSALDVSVQAQVLNLLLQLKNELNLTLVFIAHNLDVVRYLCDRVAVMYLGQIVEEAPVATLFANPQHPYTRALLQARPVANPALAAALVQARTALIGDPPNAAHPPSGCSYHPRCPYALAECKSLAPQLTPSGASQVACHVAQVGQLPHYVDLEASLAF